MTILRTILVWFVLIAGFVLLYPYLGETSGSGGVIFELLTAIIAVAAIIFFFRRMGAQSSAGNLMKLRQSTARLVDEKGKVTFDQIGGCEDAKADLEDVIDFIKNPDRWIKAGARLPRAVLLEGPPGCGKTLLARAVAGETNAKFFLTAGSEFVELFVGVGAARVRDLFDTARKAAPAVIFIDELDAIGRARGSSWNIGIDEREQTLDQLLVCMDGFTPTEKVVILAATNRSDILDRALLRPGRFDRIISIPTLGEAQRLSVLKIHTKNKGLAPEVNLSSVAKATELFTGADLEGIANEAALLAVRRSRLNGGGEPRLTSEDFDLAINRLKERHTNFQGTESMLIDSTLQLVRSQDALAVRVSVDRGDTVEGILEWANSSFLKVRRGTTDPGVVISKSSVSKIELLK